MFWVINSPVISVCLEVSNFLKYSTTSEEQLNFYYQMGSCAKSKKISFCSMHGKMLFGHLTCYITYLILSKFWCPLLNNTLFNHVQQTNESYQHTMWIRSMLKYRLLLMLHAGCLSEKQGLGSILNRNCSSIMQSLRLSEGVSGLQMIPLHVIESNTTSGHVKSCFVNFSSTFLNSF